MKGGSTDGNRYIDKALAAGALGIITDSAPTFDHLLVYQAGVPLLQVEHGRRALARASAAFFGHPERKLAATGITGTNGKTTTAFLVEALLNAAARKTILIGTIEYHVAGEVRPSLHTTPESRDLFELMAEGAALRRHRTRHRSFKPRPRPGPRRRHPIRRGRLHQPHSRSPRLSPDDGEVLRRQATSVRRHRLSGPARGRDQRARRARERTSLEAARSAGAEVRTYGIGMGDWRAANHSLTPGGAVIDLETPAGSARITSRLAGEVNISQPARRSRGGPRARRAFR